MGVAASSHREVALLDYLLSSPLDDPRGVHQLAVAGDGHTVLDSIGHEEPQRPLTLAFLGVEMSLDLGTKVERRLLAALDGQLEAALG